MSSAVSASPKGTKKRAIVLALQTWPKMSTTKIAEQVGCSQQRVSQVKSEVTRTSHLPDRVVGKDGKSYPASKRTTGNRSRQSKPKITLSATATLPSDTGS